MKSMEDWTVLVTGAAGFIGANLACELAKRGMKVHALVRPGGTLERLTDMRPEATVHRVDLDDAARLRKVVRGIAPRAIFHAAAPGLHPEFPAERRRMLSSCLFGTYNLLEAAMPVEYEAFVHVGSSTEYGARSGALRESDALEPTIFRGVVKAASTLLIRQFSLEYGKPLAVVRPFSVYGPWEQPHRLVPTAMMAVLEGREIRLTAPGFRRDFVFVDDVVKACIRALERGPFRGDIFNVGSGKQWTNEVVVERILRISGTRVPVLAGAYPSRPVDTGHWVADIRKAGRLLGWKPEHTLDEGLQKTYDWFRNHHAFYAGKSSRPGR